MQPDQQSQPDYNFIVNNSPQKKRLLGGGSKKQRLLLVVAGGGMLLVIFGIVFALLFGSGSGNMDQLVKLATDQTEIIRIAEIGEKEAKSTDTKNLAVTVKLSMRSAHNSLVTQLASQGRKLNAKDLAAAKDPDTDEAFLAATQANRFDEVFTETLQSAVNDYQAAVREAYEAASSTKQKRVLEAIFNQTSQLTTTE